jgi:predicted nucleic acid-binding protein
MAQVLTALPVRPRIGPAAARALVRENTESAAEIVTLSANDYDRTIERLARLGIGGGAVYDALIARAAEKSGVEQLVTLDERDFLRVWPEGRRVITAA